MLGMVMAGEAQPIIYKRGHLTLNITANPDSPREPIQSGDGFSVSFGERDFAMNAADLGSFKMPEDGDLIQWASGGVMYVYKVLQTEGTKCFDWLDNHHIRLVAHTKLLHTV